MKPDTSVYFLHGLMGTCAEHCGRQIQAWRETHRIVLIDLPGHGRAPRDAARPYVDAAVAALRVTMQRHGPGHLIGLSYLGGSIAVRAALAYPELITDLVLSGFVADIRPEVFRGWIDGFVRLGDMNPPLAQHYDAIHGPRWRSTLKIISEECREAYPSSFAIGREMIANLSVPTLILNGDLKSEESVAAATLPELGPSIDGMTIPGAGHLPGYERPAEFNRAVEQFWSSVDV